MYGPKIAEDNRAIAGFQAQLTSAQQDVARAQQAVQAANLAVTCEGNGISESANCPKGTGLYGDGPVYQVRLTELQNAKANLASAQAADTALGAKVDPQLTAAENDLQTQTAERYVRVN